GGAAPLRPGARVPPPAPPPATSTARARRRSRRRPVRRRPMSHRPRRSPWASGACSRGPAPGLPAFVIADLGSQLTERRCCGSAKNCSYVNFLCVRGAAGTAIEREDMENGTTDAAGRGSAARTGAGATRADPRRWLTLTVMLAAMAMDLLDVSIVNLALPAIRDDIGASPRRAGLDRRELPALLRRAPGDGRPTGRRVRPQADVHRGRGRLHRGLGAVRRRPDRRRADRRPGTAGGVRRAHDTADPLGHPGRVPTRPATEGLRRVR